MKGVITNNKKPPLTQFPKLMRGVTSGAVYSMQSATEGIQLTDGYSTVHSTSIGCHFTNLVPNNLKDFHGTIELTED